MYIEEIPKKLSNTNLLVLFVVMLYRQALVAEIIAIVSAVANENKQVVERAIAKLKDEGYLKYYSKTSKSMLKSQIVFSHTVFVKLYKLMREKFGVYYFTSKARELKGSEFAELTKLDLHLMNTIADYIIYILVHKELSDLVLPSNFCTKNAKSLECMREAAYIVATSVIDVDFSRYEAVDGCYNFVLFYLNASFLLGNDFQKSLRSIPVSYIRNDEALLAMCMVLATWIGDGDYFGELAKYSSPEILNINFGCIRIFKGDIAEADKFFKRYGKKSLEMGIREDFDNFPVRFLTALTSAVSKEGKLAKTPPIRYIAGHNLDERLRITKSSESVGGYCTLESHTAQAFCAGWATFPSNVAEAITCVSSRKDWLTLRSLFKASDIYSKHLNNENKVFLSDVLLDIKSWIAKGYILYANLLSALISGAVSLPDKVREVLETSSVRLLKATEYQPAWAHTLHALEDVAKKIKVDTDDAPIAKPKRFYWYVSLDEKPEYDRSTFETSVVHVFCDLRRIGVVLFDDDKDGIFVSPTLYDGKKGLASDDILQYCDRDDFMIMNRIISCADGYYGDYHFTASDKAMIFKHLSGKDNVVIRDVDHSYVPFSYTIEYKFSKIKIKVEEVEMSASYDERGQLSLSLPEWVFSASQNEVLLKTGDNEFTLYQINRRVKDVVSIFKEHGHNGKLLFPEESLEKVMPCAMKIENVLPVAPPKEEEVANLRRVRGNSLVTVRIAYHGDTITVEAVVVPVLHLKGLAFPPGEGTSERVLHDVAGPYLLVRDIDNERANFEVVKGAICSSEEWCETKAPNKWKITNIIKGIELVERLKALGDVAILEWLQNEIKLTISSQTKFRKKSGTTVDEWFGIQGDFELDDGRIIGITEMLSAMKCHNENYIRIGECEFLQITKRLMRELSMLDAVAHKHKGGGIEFSNAAIPTLTEVFDDEKSIIKLPEKIKCEAERIRKAFDGTPEIPDGLNATLRSYQKQGFVWLSRIASAGLGSCLADDMGLGKTIQIISVLLERALDGASLVVAPSSVTVNWISEIKRFAPSLTPVFAQQNSNYLESLTKRGVAEDEKNVVVVVSYGYLVFHEKTFSKIKWNGVVLDEAQAIKNASSQRAKVVKDIPAKFRIAATGTPIENRLGELWSIFDFLNPGLLGPASDFMDRFSKNGVATNSLKKLVRPLILRRLKENVLKDLPQKTEIVLPVELGDDERHAYEACRVHALQRLGGLIEGSEDVNRICVLAELTRLRRFCCHPELVMKGQKLPSAKMEALLDLLDELKEGGHRALIFSQFTEYLAIVTKEIENHGFSYLYLDGSTPTAERGELVKTFQKGETDFFVISLKAGGTGLNLTAADYVIILDPWWNPAVENQAADRAHRIGQRRPVTVYRLIAKDTVEERVMALHEEKLAIAEDVLDGTSSSKLSSEKLLSLFK